MDPAIANWLIRFAFLAFLGGILYYLIRSGAVSGGRHDENRKQTDGR